MEDRKFCCRETYLRKRQEEWTFVLGLGSHALYLSTRVRFLLQLPADVDPGSYW